jgi:3-oxoadipate enol-lactonase
MPMFHVHGAELYYDDTSGRGPAILFSHGLLWDTSLFAPQTAALKCRYRCVACDLRREGQSADSDLRAIDMETLFADAVALIEAPDLKPVHVCGLSMGGFVAPRRGARRPDLVSSLLHTSSDPEPRQNVLKYRLWNWLARRSGGFVDATMPMMMGRSTLSDPVRAAERDAWRRQLRSNRRSLWRALNDVIESPSVYHELSLHHGAHTGHRRRRGLCHRASQGGTDRRSDCRCQAGAYLARRPHRDRRAAAGSHAGDRRLSRRSRLSYHGSGQHETYG